MYKHIGINAVPPFQPYIRNSVCCRGSIETGVILDKRRLVSMPRIRKNATPRIAANPRA